MIFVSILFVCWGDLNFERRDKNFHLLFERHGNLILVGLDYIYRLLPPLSLSLLATELPITLLPLKHFTDSWIKQSCCKWFNRWEQRYWVLLSDSSQESQRFFDAVPTDHLPDIWRTFWTSMVLLYFISVSTSTYKIRRFFKLNHQYSNCGLRLCQNYNIYELYLSWHIIRI